MTRICFNDGLSFPRATRLPAVGMVLFAVAMLLASGPGCAEPVKYRISKQLMEEENYDQAVVELRKLVAAEPRNSQYQLRLGEAESKAADQHVSRAKALRAQHLSLIHI